MEPYVPVVNKDHFECAVFIRIFLTIYRFVTNTELPSEKIVIAYEKRGHAENYIQEAKYDWHAPSRSDKGYGGWISFAPILLGRRSYLSVDDTGLQFILLFKMDFAKGAEYRQQIKTVRLKYIFLAGKIIRTARNVIMKLPEKYPYQEIYAQSLP